CIAVSSDRAAFSLPAFSAAAESDSSALEPVTTRRKAPTHNPANLMFFMGISDHPGSALSRICWAHGKKFQPLGTGLILNEIAQVLEFDGEVHIIDHHFF